MVIKFLIVLVAFSERTVVVKPDRWELSNGLNPRNFGDENLDFDGDGVINLVEYEFETDPRTPDTDGDHVDDGGEITRGRNPNVNEGAEMTVNPLLLD